MKKTKDNIFKSLFSDKDLFYMLLKDFVKAPWVKEVTKDSLELVPASFIDSVDENRESDIYYYAVETNKLPNLENVNYTESEINKHFELIYIDLDDAINIIKENIPNHKDNKIISSISGPHGGLYMTEKAKNLPVGIILKAMGEDDTINRCVLGLTKCSENKPCPMHHKYKYIKEELKISMSF